MKKTESKTNKTLLRVLLAAAAVLILCGAFCGAAAAADGNVAKNVGTGVEYATVQAAVDAADPGQTILMIADSTEQTVVVGKEITLNLNGYVLKNNSEEKTVGPSGFKCLMVIYVQPAGKLTVMDEITTRHYFKYHANEAWEATTDTTNAKPISEFDLSAAENAIFYVEGGCITGGNAKMGGGVYVEGGTFSMAGGNIVGNNANGSNSSDGGGGVYVYQNGTFTMTGGNIVGNSAKVTSNIAGGGGVRVVNGKFTMNGGNISGNNTSANGGGVDVFGDGTFEMTGNSNISGNTAEYSGGGVSKSGGTFSMTGGTIVGNSTLDMGGGAAIYSGTFNVSGNPVIKDNKSSGGDNNVFLYTYMTQDVIHVTGAFSGEIHVCSATPAQQFGSTTGSTDNKKASGFISDNKAPGGQPYVGKWEGLKLIWAEKGKEKPSSSSRNQGTSIWLTATPTPEPTATPTPTPTAEPSQSPTQGVPTVKPITTQTATPATPAPIIGILAGLGAAAAVFALRRK